MGQDDTNNTSKTFSELLDLYASNTREREREREREAIELLKQAPFINEKNISPNIIEQYVRQLSKEFGAKYAIYIFQIIEKIYDNAISAGLYSRQNPCHQIKNIKKITNYKQNIILLVATWSLVILTVFSLTAFAASKFIIKVFGNVNIDQLLLHIRMAEGINIVDASIIKRAIKYGSQVTAVSIILIIMTCFVLNYRHIKNKIKTAWIKFKTTVAMLKHSYVAKNVIYSMCLIGIISVSLFRTNKLLPFAQWATRKSSHWIEKNYYQLDTSHATFNSDQKRNLIMIVLESIEDGFKERSCYDANLIQELTALQSKGICFYGYKKTPGASCTIDGLSAQTTGMPLVNIDRLWIRQSKYHNLLAKTPSIFNLLNNLGYKTAWFSGASGKFTAKHNFFASHGMQECYDRECWQKLGHQISINNAGISRFGYNDEFLFEQLQRWLNDNHNTNAPFAVLFETADTHAPNGFAKQSYFHFGDHRDSIRAASIMTSNFIKWAQQQPWYKNTTIVIVGDHPWQNWDCTFTQRFARRSRNREIFNLILNSTIGTDGQCFNITGGFSPMDLAPTYLNAMGINFSSHNKKFGISNSRLGIGQSLFCQEPTIISKLGHEKFVDKVTRKSKFYRELF